MEPKPLLEVTGLVVAHGGIVALDSVDIAIEPGEVVALLGANGSGKTTVIETIMGLNKPTKGSIRFLQREIAGMSGDRITKLGIAVVPEGRGVFTSMTVEDNLRLGGDAGPRQRHQIDEVFHRFPVLFDRRRQAAGTLSGGEGRMLVIARALMSTPRLILLDEPSIGLAPSVLRSVFDLIADLSIRGHTILIAEQNAHQALRVAHRGYVLERGRVVHEGIAEDLRNDLRIAEAYLGAI